MYRPCSGVRHRHELFRCSCSRCHSAVPTGEQNYTEWAELHLTLPPSCVHPKAQWHKAIFLGGRVTAETWSPYPTVSNMQRCRDGKNYMKTCLSGTGNGPHVPLLCLLSHRESAQSPCSWEQHPLSSPCHNTERDNMSFSTGYPVDLCLSHFSGPSWVHRAATPQASGCLWDLRDRNMQGLLTPRASQVQVIAPFSK